MGKPADMASVFIYGVPGAGKTAFSMALQRETGMPLIEADGLRETITDSRDPFVRIGTSEAFREFGSLSPENAINGLIAVRNSMAQYAAREIKNHPGLVIMEGAFLDPASLPAQSLRVFLATSDEARHQSQYFAHREPTPAALEAFAAARMIQAYLAKESRGLPVIVIENDRDPDRLAAEFASRHLK